jgi:hypothetical protein
MVSVERPLAAIPLIARTATDVQKSWMNRCISVVTA